MVQLQPLPLPNITPTGQPSNRLALAAGGAPAGGGAPATSSGYNNAYQQLLQQAAAFGSNDTATLNKRLAAVGDQFTQLWTNLVGRAPTADELNHFYNTSAGQIITTSAGGLGRSEADPTGVRNQIAQYVGDTGQKASQDYATQQLTAQQGQANDLANLFRTQGNTAISSAESSLLDYQQKLFERLRPNLITSLQSQGLLNTGGMNEALAGKQADLANEGANTVAQLKLQNENQANAIAYGGASAPYLFNQSQITNQPQSLLQQGQAALNQNNATYMSNLDFTHQLALINANAQAQQSLQPSFLRSFGQSAATSLGSNFSGPAWLNGSSSTSASGAKTTGVASLFA